MLRKVRIPLPEKRLGDYPHQFSGGMRQRVMIAMALSCNPELLIADEPTTALDVTIQAQVLELMNELQRETGAAIILITHDLGVVAEFCKNVLVMYGGNMVEYGTAEQIFAQPRMPYTQGLLASLPRLDRSEHRRLEPIAGQPPNLLALAAGLRLRAALRLPHADLRRAGAALRFRRGPRRAVLPLRRARERAAPRERSATLPDDSGGRPVNNGALVEVKDLFKYFPIHAGLMSRHVADVRAVDGVSFRIDEGETLGLVGESGSGKTTIGRLLLRLLPATKGEIIFEDRGRPGDEPQRDPPAAPLDADHLPGSVRLAQSAHVGRRDHRRAAAHSRDRHGQGGRRARARAARAGRPAARTTPTAIRTSSPAGSASASASRARSPSIRGSSSATSRSRRSTSRFRRRSSTCSRTCRQQLRLTYLFIAHDLSVVRHISTRVAVMYVGKIVELADRDELYEHPLHPYTQALLSAIPIPDPVLEKRRKRIVLTGDIPSPVNPPSGCRFHTRCPIAFERCTIEEPPLREYAPGHFAACHWVEEHGGKAPELVYGSRNQARSKKNGRPLYAVARRSIARYLGATSSYAARSCDLAGRLSERTALRGYLTAYHLAGYFPAHGLASYLARPPCEPLCGDRLACAFRRHLAGDLPASDLARYFPATFLRTAFRTRLADQLARTLLRTALRLIAPTIAFLTAALPTAFLRRRTTFSARLRHRRDPCRSLWNRSPFIPPRPRGR